MLAIYDKELRERYLEKWAAIQVEELTFRPIRKVSEWASEVRRIPAGQSPFATFASIPYDHAIMPHCVEPMDAADDPSIHRIVLWWGIRDGKTLGVCANIIGRTCTDDPGNIYSVNPTDDDAARFSEGDLEPMIEACLQSANFVEKKSRESGRTIEFKKYAGGWIRIISAGSKTKFRGTSVKVMLLHELDALDAESIHKAINRTTGFRDAIIVEESTGTLAATYDEKGKKIYNSHIEEAYEQGDMRKWFVPCRECYRLFVIKFHHIKHRSEELEGAYVECPNCGCAHNENQWRRMQARGKWYPTAGLSEAQQTEIEKWHNNAKAKDPVVRSYWRNGFNSLLMTGKGYKTKLHQFVAEEKASNTSREARKTWVNEIAAELWSDEETQPAPPWQPILDGREDYATAEKVTIPKDGLIVTCFTDVQSNRLETEWRAWSREEESWGLGHYIIEGAYNDWETWKAWEKSMQKKWQHESGLAIGLTFGMVDAGKWGDMIANVLRKLTKDAVPGVSGKVRASKGVGEANAVVYRRSGQITPQWKGVHIGTWLAKEIIYDRLSWFGAAEKPSAGFMHFGKCYSDEFVRQLVSEKPEKVRARSGAEILRFKNPDGVRNEALDLVVGNLACFRYRTRWDFETAERQVAEFRQTKVEPAEKDETISLGRAGGWR